MLITTSPDISTLDFEALVDLSAVDPVVIVTSKCAGNNIAGCKFIFKLVTPGGLTAYQGDFGVPDKAGVWDTFQLPALPQVGGHIEWGGNGYQITVSVRDTGNQEFSETHARTICRPNGNTTASKHNFGVMQLSTEVRCADAKLYVEDKSNYLYGGVPGIEAAKKLTLIYPGEDPDNITPPFTRALGFGSLFIPLYVNGEGHQLLAEDVRDYGDASGITVRIKYKYRDTFPVLCHVDLCGVIAAVRDYEKRLKAEGATADERENLLLVNAKLNMILVARSQPGCGVDIHELIEEIEELLDVDTDCGCNYGVNPLADIAAAGAAGATDCAAVVNCVNGALTALDPKGAMTPDAWGGANFQQRMQALINAIGTFSFTTISMVVGKPYYTVNNEMQNAGSPAQNIAGASEMTINELKPNGNRQKIILAFQRGSGTEGPAITYTWAAADGKISLLNGAVFGDAEGIYIVAF